MLYDSDIDYLRGLQWRIGDRAREGPSRFLAARYRRNPLLDPAIGGTPWGLRFGSYHRAGGGRPASNIVGGPRRSYQPDPSPRGPRLLRDYSADIATKLDPKLGSQLWDLTRHGLGAQWARESLGLAGKPGGDTGFWRALRTPGQRGLGLIGKGLFPAFTAYNAYSGWREGGAWGAAKGVGLGLAETYAFGTAVSFAGKMIGGTAGLAGIGLVATGAAVVFGPVWAAKKAMEAGGQRIKSARRLELATPHLDLYGGAATMRQRSIAAMNRSALNGRYLLGNEGAVFHR